MAEHFAVFLRGVNVNGTRMKMDDLKGAFRAMGFKNPKTLLASGNVVVSSDEASMTLIDHKIKIEMNLSLYFGYEAYVIVKSVSEVDAIVAESLTHQVPDGYHHYLMLTNDEHLGVALSGIFDNCEKANMEKFMVESNGLYWIIPKGNTLQSDFGEKVLGKKGYRSRLTSRTMNTVIKVQKALRERVGN